MDPECVCVCSKGSGKRLRISNLIGIYHLEQSFPPEPLLLSKKSRVILMLENKVCKNKIYLTAVPDLQFALLKLH